MNLLYTWRKRLDFTVLLVPIEREPAVGSVRDLLSDYFALRANIHVDKEQ